MTDYNGLTTDQLKEKLKELQDLFEEVTEERMIILGQENIHLSSRLVVKYQRELSGIKDDIACVEALLKQRSGEMST